MSFSISKSISALTLTGDTLAPNIIYTSLEGNIQNITTSPGITNILGKLIIYNPIFSPQRSIKLYSASVPPFVATNRGGITAFGSSGLEKLLMYWHNHTGGGYNNGRVLTFATNNSDTLVVRNVTSAATDITGNCSITGSKTIGGGSIEPSAILAVNSTTKGFVPPKMTSTQRNAITPVDGLQLHDTSYRRLYNCRFGNIWYGLNIFGSYAFFNGSTLEIFKSYNLSSITKLATGKYQLNFNISNDHGAKYAWYGSCGYESSTAQSNYLAAPQSTISTTWKAIIRLQIKAYYDNVLTDRDPTYVCVFTQYIL